MTITHVVTFTWNDQITDEQLAPIRAWLDSAPTLIDSIRAFHHGADVGVNQGNGDYAVVAQFDTLEGYLAYRDDPAHQLFIAEQIAPVLASRSAVQFSS